MCKKKMMLMTAISGAIAGLVFVILEKMIAMPFALMAAMLAAAMIGFAGRLFLAKRAACSIESERK